MNNASEKPQLREQNLAKRTAIAPESHAIWSEECGRRLCETIRTLMPQTAVIAGYVPIKGELDIMPALTSLAGNKYRLALPVMIKEDGRRQLTFYPWKPGEMLTPKTYGIHEPEAARGAVLPDIILVPLLAFDRRGHRLGYGGGYYDAVLRKLRVVRPAVTAIGIGFSLQEVETIPAQTYDENLSKIVTEKEVIHIA